MYREVIKHTYGIQQYKVDERTGQPHPLPRKILPKGVLVKTINKGDRVTYQVLSVLMASMQKEGG